MMDFFKKLTDEIQNHDEIIIMTHATPDLDGLGSALVLAEVIKKLNKECYIVAPKNLINKSLNKALDHLGKDGFVFPFKYEKSFEDKNPLLIVLDTQDRKLVECVDMLFVKDRCIIDHHSLVEDRIKDNICEYLDSSMSSVVEILCDYLEYLNVKVDKNYYTLLLAGLYQDTNFFTLKVTYKTFKVASYLMKMGADVVLAYDFLKEPFESVLKRYNYIKKCVKLDESVYLCTIDDRTCNNISVAKVADEMLKIEEVQMAFAIGVRDNGQIVLSGRSCDNRDVCSIMKKFGGGGHFGAAAAIVSDSSLEEVIDKLKTIVRGDL